MPMITKGDHVWYRSSPGAEEFGVAIGARVETIENKQYKLYTDDDEVKWIDVQNNTLKLMHASSVDTVEDMIQLGDLHEAGILRNLFQRYKHNKMYTYTGSILVAINPYQLLPIYDQMHIKMYQVSTELSHNTYAYCYLHGCFRIRR